mmetsp:Transcript_60544/g.194970  ORF Transcript_60544/g.194970 Transcript_60544/m.194970 type:complete len:227 (-) Transcript_60544:3-683(-)
MSGQLSGLPTPPRAPDNSREHKMGGAVRDRRRLRAVRAGPSPGVHSSEALPASDDALPQVHHLRNHEERAWHWPARRGEPSGDSDCAPTSCVQPGSNWLEVTAGAAARWSESRLHERKARKDPDDGLEFPEASLVKRNCVESHSSCTMERCRQKRAAVLCSRDRGSLSPARSMAKMLDEVVRCVSGPQAVAPRASPTSPSVQPSPLQSEALAGSLATMASAGSLVT